MSKFSFDLKSQERRRALPPKIIVGQQENQSAHHVLLKFIACMLFFRERVQIDARLHNDDIPFDPDIVALDYSLHPVLWVECGDCSVTRLDKLAVKVPESEIWVVKRSLAEAEGLHHAMARAELRRDRYGLIGLDAAMFDEMLGLLAPRNEFTWHHGGFEPPQLQFEFNGLWFDAPFTVLKF